MKNVKSYLNSDDTNNHIEEWLQSLEKYKILQNRWIEKVKIKYGNDIDFLIEKLISKYYSDEYIDREYKIGVQPREPLLWLLFEYAEKYCYVCNDEKYLNQFTGGAYYIGSYVIQTMFGQGATIKIEKNLS